MYNKIAILFLSSCFIFNSCTFKINSRLILYGTDRFKNIEQQAKFKKEDAWKIYLDYYEYYGMRRGWLVGIINKDYIFYNLRSASIGVTLSHTIRVNMITGKVRFVKTSFISGVGIGHDKQKIWRGNIDSTSINTKATE